MPETPAVPSTFVVERSYPVAPERVFAAFADMARKRRWYAEGGGYDVIAFEMDFRVGGADRLQSRFKEGTPFPGVEIVYAGVYPDIVPGARIVHASSMAIGGRRVSVSLITFEFVAAGAGCDLICTHQGVFFEGADGPQMREQGWKTLLERLAGALEPA
jgi:uncharacterized protein YndB with AHSA1/START domain